LFICHLKNLKLLNSVSRQPASQPTSQKVSHHADRMSRTSKLTHNIAHHAHCWVSRWFCVTLQQLPKHCQSTYSVRHGVTVQFKYRPTLTDEAADYRA